MIFLKKKNKKAEFIFAFSLIPTISKILPEDLRRRRQKALYIYEKFFGSAQAIVDGLTAALSDRIFPHNTQTYEFWNGPTAGVKSPIIMDSIADETGFTAVILAYERIESMFRVIEGKFDFLEQVTKYDVKKRG